MTVADPHFMLPRLIVASMVFKYLFERSNEHVPCFGPVKMDFGRHWVTDGGRSVHSIDQNKYHNSVTYPTMPSSLCET